jgi:uncharacterized membrane-anchored protein
MSDRRWLITAAIAVAVIQIIFLGSMIAGRAAILRNGQVVTLEVQPVDPRDLLRGDYVVLGYNISAIHKTLFAEPLPETIEGEHDVYVRLEEGEAGIWMPVAASFDEPLQAAPGKGQIDIRGSVDPSWWNDAETIRVDYGIERFYVPEGEGKAIEEDMRERRFRMRVAVAGSGTAQIKSFHDGEQMLYQEPIY